MPMQLTPIIAQKVCNATDNGQTDAGISRVAGRQRLIDRPPPVLSLGAAGISEAGTKTPARALLLLEMRESFLTLAHSVYPSS